MNETTMLLTTPNGNQYEYKVENGKLKYRYPDLPEARWRESMIENNTQRAIVRVLARFKEG